MVFLHFITFSGKCLITFLLCLLFFNRVLYYIRSNTKNILFICEVYHFYMNISFEYYRIFYYVAKYENITKAAMVLKSSQPNVTRIIHILEDQLDCHLFLREPRGLKLTEEGKRLYAHVAIACQHLLDAEAECSCTVEKHKAKQG